MKKCYHMCYESLVNFLVFLNVVELVKVSMVDMTWKDACYDPVLWNKIDLSAMCSSHFNIPKTLKAWRDKKSSAKMTQFLERALELSNGNVSCLVFNFYAYLRDEHLITAAESTPNLKRLVFPGTGHISKKGINVAMRSWEMLESMTVTSLANHGYIFSAIGKYCKHITEMKFTCPFEKEHADFLIKHTPNLTYLSIQRILVNMVAMTRVLTQLEHLKVVNICHSSIWDRPNERSLIDLYPVHELKHHLPIECCRKLLFCQGKRCIVCKNKASGTQLGNNPYDINEDIWRVDEIRSLAH